MTLVAFQPTYTECITQNAARSRKVPDGVIGKQMKGAEFPRLDEAHEVIWVR